MPDEREYNFDGLVGPTHNYSGLASGNLASLEHGGRASSPKRAALQGLAKMRRLLELGVPQAVLPPQPRPDLAVLRRLGFSGSDAEVIERAASDAPHWLTRCSSASSMWTANAATLAPASDTSDSRAHFVPANLRSLFHRQIEARHTTRVLRSIFADPRCFEVHDPLPLTRDLGDEGAANHTRLLSERGIVHLFAWGYDPSGTAQAPERFAARQSSEASRCVARLLRLKDGCALTWQQHPTGIDRGAFHTDVLAVGSGSFLMLHELAFVEPERLLGELRSRLGDEFRWELARESELPASDAVRAYPFNSQLVRLPDGSLCIIAPLEAAENAASRAFLERVVAGDNPVSRVEYLDVRQSMSNGGGPACLRLRVALREEARRAVTARVFLDEPLYRALVDWVERHYRDHLEPADLRDPALWRESRDALDELTGILGLGSVYEFQARGGSP